MKAIHKNINNIEFMIYDFYSKVNEKISIIVNNLGGSTDMDLYCLAKCVKERFDLLAFNCLRFTCGRFMTSLDMQGFMVTGMLSSCCCFFFTFSLEIN
jgi:dihydroxyacetone kinase